MDGIYWSASARDVYPFLPTRHLSNQAKHSPLSIRPLGLSIRLLSIRPLVSS